MHVEEDVLLGEDKRVGCLLVEIDIFKGLILELEISWQGKIYLQKVNYWGVPSRCSLCRNKSHLRKECEGPSKDPLPDFNFLDGSNVEEAHPSKSPKFALAAEEDSLLGKLKLYSPLFFSTLNELC